MTVKLMRNLRRLGLQEERPHARDRQHEQVGHKQADDGGEPFVGFGNWLHSLAGLDPHLGAGQPAKQVNTRGDRAMPAPR